MPLVQFKRLRMRFDLSWPLWDWHLPEGFRWVRWSMDFLEAHAQTKLQSFQNEIDANIFPCFSTYGGCLQLMREIASRTEFVPDATWLVEDLNNIGTYCGTVQGLRQYGGMGIGDIGAIQNLGVVPSYRSSRLGTALLAKALIGFRQQGLQYAILDVTYENRQAVRLYHHLGWKTVKVVYRSSEIHVAPD